MAGENSPVLCYSFEQAAMDDSGRYPLEVRGGAWVAATDDGNHVLYTGTGNGYALLSAAIGPEVMAALSGDYTISIDLCVGTDNALSSFCWAYGLTNGTNTYVDYEEAYEAMNGYNPTLANELVESPYKELTENAEYYGYDDSKPIQLLYGTYTDSDGTRRDFEYVKEMLETMVEGTSLEGKLEISFDASFGTAWANDFRSGAYDIASGTGFGGGAFDPSGFLQCYVDPEADLMYSTWWDTASEQLTFTMPEGDYEGAGEELTMSILNWFCCLNGIAEAYEQEYTYNWGAGFIPEDARLELTAKIEEVTLEQYYTIACTSQYSATVTGAKFSYITDEYNTFMGFGGYRYMTVNYTDSEWTQYVADHNGDLTSEYTKTN